MNLLRRGLERIFLFFGCVAVLSACPVHAACDPAPSGIVAWWPAEGNANDIVGGNNAAVVTDITYTNGKVGQAFVFDGSTSLITVPASASLAVSNLTLEAWVFPTDLNQPRPVIEYGGAGQASSIHLWINTQGGSGSVPGAIHAVIRDRNNISDSIEVDTPGGVVVLNQWNHLAFTFDDTTLTGVLYCNGVQVATATATSVLFPQPNAPVNLGYRDVASLDILGGYRFAGLLDEASIYNRALSASEIAAIYNAGSAGKCVPPPVADATATAPVVISVNGTNATVVLDGSKSYDLDGDPLQYFWLTPPANLIASGVVAVVILPVGTNSITLSVSDGALSNSQTIAVAVLTISQAVDQLIATVNQNASKTQSLVALLRAALDSIDKSNPISAVNQLQAFQNKVNVQLAPIDPVLAQSLYNDAQAIIDAIIGGGGGHVKMNVNADKANGKLHLNFAGSSGQIYIIEASTDMLHWQMIGVAKDQGNGTFQFDDSQLAQTPQRFYRVVVP